MNANAPLATINLIEPAPRKSKVRPLMLTALPLALAAVLLAGAAWNHVDLQRTQARLEGELATTQQRTATIEAAVRPHREARRDLAQTEEALAGYEATLPPRRSWGDDLARITRRLPGVATSRPDITLGGIVVALAPNASPSGYDQPPEAPGRVLFTASLTGAASSRDAVARAVAAYESDPLLLTRFQGTSARDDGFDFAIDLARFEPRPEGESDAPSVAQGVVP